MEWNSLICDQFLSEVQKSDKTFNALIKIFVDFLQMDTFSNDGINPYNMIQNIHEFLDIDKIENPIIQDIYNILLPVSDPVLVEKIKEHNNWSDFIKQLKHIYSAKGTSLSYTLWNTIFGGVNFVSPNENAVMHREYLSAIGLNHFFETRNNDVVNHAVTDIPAVILIENIESLTIDVRYFLEILRSIKPVGILLLIIYLIQLSIPMSLTSMMSAYNIFYNCVVFNPKFDFFRPFINFDIPWKIKEISDITLLDCCFSGVESVYKYTAMHLAGGSYDVSYRGWLQYDNDGKDYKLQDKTNKLIYPLVPSILNDYITNPTNVSITNGDFKSLRPEKHNKNHSVEVHTEA